LESYDAVDLNFTVRLVVMLNVSFCRLRVMMARLCMMSVGEMRMMARLLVVALLMMHCRFMVVVCTENLSPDVVVMKSAKDRA
jgi:hypothetical protein